MVYTIQEYRDKIVANNHCNTAVLRDAEIKFFGPRAKASDVSLDQYMQRFAMADDTLFYDVMDRLYIVLDKLNDRFGITDDTEGANEYKTALISVFSRVLSDIALARENMGCPDPSQETIRGLTFCAMKYIDNMRAHAFAKHHLTASPKTSLRTAIEAEIDAQIKDFDKAVKNSKFNETMPPDEVRPYMHNVVVRHTLYVIDRSCRVSKKKIAKAVEFAIGTINTPLSDNQEASDET